MRYLLAFLFVLAPLPGAAQSLEYIGELRYRRLIDPITDEDRSLVYSPEVNAREVRTGQNIDRLGRVIWRCNGDRIEVMLRADSVGVDSATIRWRVDDHRSSPEETWKAGASGVSVFAPARSARLLSLQAKSGLRLVVRVRYADTGDLDYDFALTGAEEAIGRLGCDPDRPTDDAPHGPSHRGQGTTLAIRGSYNPYQRIEERWPLHRDISFPPEWRSPL